MILSELILLAATKDPEYVIDLIATSIEHGEKVEVDVSVNGELLDAILKIKNYNGNS